LLGMRHHHRGQFGASNLYIVCQLQALTTAVIAAENEIAEVRWFFPEDYLNDEKVSQYNRLLVFSALKHSGMVQHQVDGYQQSAADYEIYLPEL
ncbi:MAG: DNA mismatch repair protein MutT, partial [Gammaproteobacteria bacterium]|nr:DNA mismatch repair protein MutT [Gammaproteobacteria bacterium]